MWQEREVGEIPSATCCTGHRGHESESDSHWEQKPALADIQRGAGLQSYKHEGPIVAGDLKLEEDPNLQARISSAPYQP